jgi:hypothetical protein
MAWRVLRKQGTAHDTAKAPLHHFARHSWHSWVQKRTLGGDWKSYDGGAWIVMGLDLTLNVHVSHKSSSLHSPGLKLQNL